jgi:dGTPase
MQSWHAELKTFLGERLYRHPKVAQTTASARDIVATLFDRYAADPQEMPKSYSSSARSLRSVADYIAGMTDRFAMREHERLTGRRVFDT